MDIYSTTKTKVLDINWLCFYLVLAALPVIELLGLAYGQPSSLPVSRALAAQVLGGVLLAIGAGRRGFSARLAWRLFLVWITVSIPVIWYLALPDSASLGFLLDFARAVTVSLAGVTVVALLERRSPRYRQLTSFIVGSTALLLGGTCVYGMLLITIIKLPLVYDPVLYRFEGILGFSNTGIFSEIMWRNSLAGNIILALYNFLNIAVILAAASEFLYSQDRRQAGLFLQFLVVAAIGYPLYYSMPALAPANFFCAAFPGNLPAVQSMATHVVSVPACAPSFAPRNTMPSLHLPLTTPARRDAVLVGAVLLGCWIMAVRGAPFTLAYPGAIQLLAISSVVFPVWGEVRLIRAERQQLYAIAAAPDGLPVLNS